jgi:formylglycine-generating enzyme required for sulfatase activity
LADTAGLAPGAVTARAAQVQVAEESRLPVEVVNTVGMRFRLIPNGSFVMGSPRDEPGRWEGEKQHMRGVSAPFYMGKLEVTQAQWDAVMGGDGNPSGFRGPRNPVEEVTWYDCQRFLALLNEREGLAPWTYRLPAETEWEYACRAGSATAYHFGNDPTRLASFDFYEANSGGRTRPCGLKPPNAFGLHDMHGNAWEWCRNIFLNYPGCEHLEDQTRGQWRAIRGGNFHVSAQDCRSAERARLPPASKGNILGFRVMRVVPELAEPKQLPPEEGRTTPPDGTGEEDAAG